MIGAGLAVCYTANVWNIGAEGQLTMGALFGSAIPVYFTGWQSPLTLVALLLLGAVGRAEERRVGTECRSRSSPSH